MSTGNEAEFWGIVDSNSGLTGFPSFDEVAAAYDPFALTRMRSIIESGIGGMARLAAELDLAEYLGEEYDTLPPGGGSTAVDLCRQRVEEEDELIKSAIAKLKKDL